MNLKTIRNLGLLVFVLSGCAYNPIAKSYFEDLCKSDAGMRITRTVDNVESVYQMKLPEKFRGKRPSLYNRFERNSEPLYWSFDYDSWTYDYPKNFGLSRDVSGLAGRPGRDFYYDEIPFTQFAYFEGRASDEASHHQFLRMTSKHVLIKPCRTNRCYAENEIRESRQEVAHITSKYGFTWRELRPPQFPHEIIGAEWSVVDLETNEVLATARDYRFFPNSIHSKYTGVSVCPKPHLEAGPIHAHLFVTRVLKPVSIGPREKVYAQKPLHP